jgi:tetratricopeptide (TPR) repeat protein
VRFIRGNRIWIQFTRGDWNQALESANAFIEECEAGAPHILESTVRDVRAAIRISRGDRDGALRDQLRSLELAQARLDLFHRLGGIASTAATYAELGRLEDARPLVREAVQLVRETGVNGALIRLALHADVIGMADDLRAALAVGAGPAVPFWRTTILLTLDGELSAAADGMARAGNPTIEANIRRHAGLRLLAAGRTDEAEDELDRALAFYRSVDASAHVAEIEAVLAGAQRDSA